MNKRIELLKERLNVKSYPLCIEKNKLITESYKQTDGAPQTIRRAKALANILNKFPIFIENGELIVGNTASKPMGLEITCWRSIWPEVELESLNQEGYSISEEDIAEIKGENEYWRGKTFTSLAGQLFDDERLWPFMQAGIVLPPWKNKEEGSGGGEAFSGIGLGPYQGFLTIDYEKILNHGINKIIEEAKQELRNIRMLSADAIEKTYFLKSVIIAHEAIINFANRFSALAKTLAEKEPDKIRKKELEKISAICHWVPANPARTFHEAIQSFWFIFLIIINPTMATSGGRFDQLMYSFYKRDKEQDTITDNEVLELLECLRIKDMQLSFTSGKGYREKWAGMAKWHNFVIGGVTQDNKDATNELTYLILEAAKDCPTPHHTITLRVHEGTPDALIIKALELVKTGIGMPAFIGDKSYIEYLLSQGIPIKDARNYALAGCLEPNIPGQSRILAIPMFIIPLVFDIFMHNGIEPRTGKQLGLKTGELESFKSFDTLMDAFKKQLAHFIFLNAERNNILLKVVGDGFPDPMTSSLMIEGIKEGKDLWKRTFLFDNASSFCAVGMINVADSLAAIKKIIYDDKKVTMNELRGALSANWQGEKYENMRKIFLSAPKYGNDDDYVDLIAKDLYQFWAETISLLPTIFGGNHKPSAVSISAQWPGGALTGATPDGRYAGECLADGAASAMRGMDIHGPTALIKSALKIDHVLLQSDLLNMKFHPSALKSTEDLRKLAILIKTYFSGGGKHIQFNVVSKDTLTNAQENPQNSRDLIVRVAGYSAYFVQLGKVIQDEIIGRTEHELNR